MYNLYLDKPEDFVCEVSVKNASLKGSIARLIVESIDGINLIFNGTIINGKCNIPIRKLKGLLEENTKGKISLEVIVEDTYFKPWVSDFNVEEHTSVKVSVNESEQSKPSKPIVSVKVPSSKPSLHSGAAELAIICEQFGISKKDIATNPIKKNNFKQVIKEYFLSNPEYNTHKKEILQQLSLILR